MEVNVEPTLTIATNSEVVCVEFSPFEWSQDLLAVALPSALNIYSLKFEAGTDSNKAPTFQLVCESQLEGESTSLAWSPQSSLCSSPPLLVLLLSTTDDAVLQFATDLKTTAVTELFRHSGSINSVCCSSSGLCASVGDDQLLRVWQEQADICPSDPQQQSDQDASWTESMMLMEPGQSVRFHPDNPNLLLVCEVSGTFRMYRINPTNPEDFGQPVLTAEWSARCPAPTLDADWSLCDVKMLVAAGPSGVTILNMEDNGSVRRTVRSLGTSTPSNSVSSNATSGATCVRACRNTRNLLAGVTGDNTLTVVHATANRVPLAAHLKAVSGLSWHLMRPVLAVGSDRRLLLWKVQHI